MTGEGVIRPWGITAGYYVATFSALERETTVWVDLTTLSAYDREGFLGATAPHRAALGKYSPDLRAHLNRLSGAETVTIMVGFASDWREAALADYRAKSSVKLSLDGRPESTNDEANRQANLELRTLRKGQLAVDAASVRVVARGLGLNVDYVSEFVPMAWVTGTRASLEEFVKQESILYAFASYSTQLAMESARDTVRASYSYANDYKGQGTTIAVVEYDNVDFNAPDLDPITTSEYDRIAIGGCCHTDTHPTWVMGAIASRTSGHRGIAPQAFFLSSATDGSFGNQASDYEIIRAVERAVNHSSAPDVINLSLVADSGQNGFSGDGAQAMSAYLDNLVDVENVHVAGAVGNDYSLSRQCSVPSGQENRAQSPGSGWNVLSAGILHDHNDGDWSNDEMWFEGSSYGEDGDPGFCHIDPPGNPGDPITRVKPEIAAPGYDVDVAGLTNNTIGTSIATPMVAGTMAVVIGQDPAELRNYPEVVRAIIVAASDIHQTDAAHDYNSAEGYGTLNVEWSSRVVERIAGKTGFGRMVFAGTGDYPHFGSPSSKFLTWTTDNNRARIVTAWNSHGVYSDSDFSDSDASWSDRRFADFNVYIRTLGGTLVESCTRQATNYEVCSWASNPGTTYEIEIRPVQWGATIATESVGWARVSH